MSITFVCGPMFSGKTRYLSELYDRLTRKHRKVVAVKHPLHTRVERSDGRFRPAESDELVSLCLATPDGRDVVEFSTHTVADALLIDEVQFYDLSVLTALQTLNRRGVEVVAAGLDLDAQGRPWAVSGPLACLADTVIKLKAVCDCGADANRTVALQPTDGVRVGGSESYQATCARCWYA